MRSIRAWVRICIVVGAVAPGPFSFADAEAQVVPPRPLAQPLPEPPKNRFDLAMEGWVVVRYTILADGRTANVRAVDRMPPALVDRGAVSAVKAWTFEPATNAGQPIEWHNNESVLVFDLDTVPLEPSPLFMQEYIEADGLIRSEELDKALTRNESMLTTLTSRLAEIGLAQMQNSIIQTSLGDLHAAYAAILRATDPLVPALGPDSLKVALAYRNALEFRLGDAVGVLATLARRNEIEPVPESDPIVAQAAAIEQALDGDQPIAIKAKILDEHWFHAPTRRTFAIGEVNGELDSIQVDCNRRSTEIPYSPDSEWTLPESWGACSLMVEGSRDTEFVFYEFR